MYEYNANIIRVYDGDTVWADLDLGFGLWMRNQAIRLRGTVSYTHLRAPRDGLLSRMPSSA